MHNGPSEASILRSLLEKEIREHTATKLVIEQIRQKARNLLEDDGADSGYYIDFVESVAKEKEENE